MKTITVIAILISIFFSACESDKKIIPSGKVIKIGVLAPISGKYKRLGNQSILGLKAANEMQKYLSNGDEIVFEIVDSHSNNKSSNKAFLQLVESDVVSMFSFMSSDATLYMSREFQNKKIPIISTLATANELVSINSYLAQVCIDNNMQAVVASHYIKDEKLIQNVGVLYDKQSKYSSSLAHEFKEYFINLGGKIKFFVDINTADGLKQFEQLNKKDIEMLFVSTNALQTEKILKINKTQKSTFEVLGTDGLFSGALELDSMKYFEGLYVLEHYAHSVNRSDKRKRLEKLLDKDGFKESSYAFLSYDGYQLLIYALENCSDYSRECVNTMLKDSGIIEGVSNNFSMIEAKAKREVYVDIIKNSKLKKEVVIY